jgi:pimeloyl-ACP methyl ester carboxylesterase
LTFKKRDYRDLFVKVNDYKIHCIEYGEPGKDLVLLHGHGAFDYVYAVDNFIFGLSNDYRILAFDLLGHGASDDPHEPLGYIEHSEIMSEATRKMGIEETMLIGFSYGGRLAMILAANHPEYVKKLVLVDIAPQTYESSIAMEIDDMPKYFEDDGKVVDFLGIKYGLSKLAAIKYVETLRRDDEGRVFVPSHPSRWVNLRRDGDGWYFYRRIVCPILLIRAFDGLVSHETQHKMSAENANLEVVTISDSNHSNILFSNESLHQMKSFLSRI